MYTEVVDLLLLLLAAGATEQEAEAPYVPHQCLLDTCSPYQLTKLNELLSKVSKTGNMAELQKVVNEAIISGVRLSFAENEDYYFTDYVIEKISWLEKSPEVASDIVCTLTSRGAKLRNSNSLKVIDTIALGFKAHKANLIEAHEKYVNDAQEFLEIAEGTTSGKLRDARMDNSTFYLEYSKDSKIDIAKVTDGVRNLGLTQGSIEYGRDVIKIDKSEVEIIMQEGIRNYTDLADNSDIVLTFYTSKGELEVRLYSDVQNKDLIRVEVNNQDLLGRLKNCKEEIGKNCLLGGLTVNKAIEQGYFAKFGKLHQPSSPSKKVSEEVIAAVKDLQCGDIVNSLLSDMSSSKAVIQKNEERSL